MKTNRALKVWFLGVMVFAVLFSSDTMQAADYSRLYSRDTLQQAYQAYAENLRGVWNEDLLGRLTVTERQAASNIRLSLPLVGRHAHPFDYYAQAASGEVTIPILSVKFFDDIAIATAWLERKGCETLVVSDYVGMIRYQDPTNFPRGQFPPPLQALGVPDDALEDSFVNDVSGKALKSAIYFLMAHELAHVLYGHQGSTPQRESEADAFALNLMRRISVTPMGMSIFFLVASRFELAPGDFQSLSLYERYLREEATHPLTSSRLLSIAQGIRSNVDSFTRGQPSPRLWRPRIFSVADDIEGIGRILDDPAIRELQRARSRTVTVSELTAACP